MKGRVLIPASRIFKQPHGVVLNNNRWQQNEKGIKMETVSPDLPSTEGNALTGGQSYRFNRWIFSRPLPFTTGASSFFQPQKIATETHTPACC